MNEGKSIPDYSGICRCCFAPIVSGHELRLRPNGLLFHRRCVELYPDNYYLKLERRRLARQLQHENLKGEKYD